MFKLTTTTILLSSIFLTIALEHGQQEEDTFSLFMPRSGDDNVFVLDLTNVDHANGAEIPRNLTEEDTKIIATNIDFAALKEAYAKENKAERFLPSRLIFEEKK